MLISLVLDDDVAKMLERARCSADLNRLVNDLLRVGLKQAMACKQPQPLYRTPSHDAGRCLVGDIVKIHQVIGEIEGPAAQ